MHKTAQICGKKINLYLPMPIRALLGLIAQVVISILGLIPGASLTMNRINGDIERWMNGHIGEEGTKSLGRRLKEGYYIAPCQQPLFALKAAPKITNRSEDRIIINEACEEGEARMVAFRAIANAANFGRRYPIVSYEPNKRPMPTLLAAGASRDEAD